MELELGLKITKTIDGSQSSHVRIVKDRGGALFLSQETQITFILIAYLKGYKRDDIKININKDGTLIEISGEREVQEMVMSGWMMLRREPEIRGFKKTFKIPHGVVLDQITANFIEYESTLTIYMPKEVKGMTGDQIKEVHNKDLLGTNNQENEKQDHKDAKQMDEEMSNRVEEEIQEEKAETNERGGRDGGDTCQREKDDEDKDEGSQELEEKMVVANKTSNLFAPCFFMGSVLIGTLLVFVCSLVRPNKKQS